MCCHLTWFLPFIRLIVGTDTSQEGIRNGFNQWCCSTKQVPSSAVQQLCVSVILNDHIVRSAIGKDPVNPARQTAAMASTCEFVRSLQHAQLLLTNVQELFRQQKQEPSHLA